MLYDPRWEQKTKADPFALGSLIAWLEVQPADTNYKWECFSGGCLIGLYSRAIGCNFHYCHTAFFKRRELSLARDAPHTFGAALKRARKMAAS